MIKSYIFSKTEMFIKCLNFRVTTKMATQKILSILFTAFLLVASLSLISAATIVQPLTSITESLSVNATTATATAITLENSVSVTPTVSAANYILNMSVPGLNYANLLLGKTYTSTIFAEQNSTLNQTVALNLQKAYCSNGSSTNSTRYLTVESVKDVSSDTKFKWKSGDDVTLKVKVEYTNDADDEDEIDAIIKVELYDIQEYKFIDFDNQDDLEADVSLAEGDSVEEEFTLQVPIEDLEDSDTRYRLYVKVYEDGKESSLCKDNIDGSEYFKQINLIKSSNEVVLKNLEISSPIPCGQEATITGTAWNIGTDDEDKVYIKVVSGLLGISNLTTEEFSLDEASSKGINLGFIVPKNVTQSSYDIFVTAYYKYSKNSGYQKYTEEPYKLTLKIDSCKNEVKNASITAEFSADTPKAIIGGQTVIEATIRNTGNTDSTYTISVSDNSAWSKATIDPSTVTIPAGQSSKVKIYLDINSDAVEGNKEFTITATTTGLAVNQKVSIPLEKGLTTQGIVNHFKNNWYIYAIVLVNLVLIMAIIIAVKSIVRRD